MEADNISFESHRSPELVGNSETSNQRKAPIPKHLRNCSEVLRDSDSQNMFSDSMIQAADSLYNVSPSIYAIPATPQRLEITLTPLNLIKSKSKTTLETETWEKSKLPRLSLGSNKLVSSNSGV